VDMAEFAAAKEGVLREFLALKAARRRTTPSVVSFRAWIRPPLLLAFRRISTRSEPPAGSRSPSIAKSYAERDRAVGASPLPMVSAFASETRLTLRQVAVEAPSNEIPAVPARLSLLWLQDCTWHSMHCTRSGRQRKPSWTGRR
jgi:hypothetical protein